MLLEHKSYNFLLLQLSLTMSVVIQHKTTKNEPTLYQRLFEVLDNGGITLHASDHTEVPTQAQAP